MLNDFRGSAFLDFSAFPQHVTANMLQVLNIYPEFFKFHDYFKVLNYVISYNDNVIIYVYTVNNMLKITGNIFSSI